MSEHFNKLTPAQQERLSLLLEEMGEVIQIIGKIQRHGYSSYNPQDMESGTNTALLEKELGDVVQAIKMLDKSKDISLKWINSHVIRRWTSVQKFLHHQPADMFEGVEL